MSHVLSVAVVLFAWISPHAKASVYKNLAVGDAFTCAVTELNKIRCWGKGGEILDIPSSITSGNIQDIQAGGYHACVLADDKVKCWGDNDLGQLDIPAKVAAMRLQSLSVGYVHTCVIDEQDNPYCWGDDVDGDTTIPAGLGKVREIAAGQFTTCALKVSGTVHCWGMAGDDLNVPADLLNPRNIQTGLSFGVCADTDKGLRCWGGLPNFNLSGIYGYSLAVKFGCASTNTGGICWDWPKGVARPKRVFDLAKGPPLKIESTYSRACALWRDEIRCWEQDPMWNDSLESSAPGDFKDIRKVDLTGMGKCLLDGKSVHCWDDSPQGRKNELSKIPSDVRDVVDLSTGQDMACALMQNRTVKCWSSSEDRWGELSPPLALSNPTQISTGDYHSCVLDGGRPRCWGLNHYKQAEPPLSLKNVTQIAMGGYHSCAVQNNRVTCWGDNSKGETSVPAISGTIRKLVAKNRLSCVLTDGQRVICWGKDADREFAVPAGLRGVRDIAINHSSICALVADGIRCWGRDNMVNKHPAFKTATQIFGGGFETCALSPERLRCLDHELLPPDAHWEIWRQAL